MKDITGKTLSIGDKVVVAPKNYRGLIVAVIKAFTPRQVRLIYMNNWNYSKPGREEEYLVPPSFIAKVD